MQESTAGRIAFPTNFQAQQLLCHCTLASVSASANFDSKFALHRNGAARLAKSVIDSDALSVRFTGLLRAAKFANCGKEVCGRQIAADFTACS